MLVLTVRYNCLTLCLTFHYLKKKLVKQNKIVFTLPESQVILSGVDKLSRGDTVFAVYPDTTSFYQATVVQAPRKNTGGGGHGAFVLVNFVDDSDEFGITHDKAVPTKHVMHPPYNATIQ